MPGTDDLAGLVLHGELESWVAAGLTPVDVLRAATLGGARFLGREAELGTIAVGKRASLYLVEGDPLTDIRAIRRGRLVVKDGALFFPEEIHAVVSALASGPCACSSPAWSRTRSSRRCMRSSSRCARRRRRRAGCPRRRFI